MRAVAEQRYDAILLDVMLPGIDGFETCGRIRAAGVSVPRGRWNQCSAGGASVVRCSTSF